MIHFFNRKELLITMDMKRQADVRGVLDTNGIEHIVKTTNLQSASVVGSHRGHTGSFGINQDHSYEYKIYVKKEDFERASYLIRE